MSLQIISDCYCCTSRGQYFPCFKDNQSISFELLRDKTKQINEEKKLQEPLSTKWGSSSKNKLERKELKVTCKPLLMMSFKNGKK